MSSQPAPPASAGRRSLRARGALSAALVALACLLAPLGTLSAWATYEVGDVRRYVGAMRAPAAEPGVRRAVTDAVTEEILTELAAGPPENAGAGPPPGAVRDLVRRTVWSFTGTSAFREAWDTANRTTHDALMKGLREDGGEVAVDLAPVLAQAAGRRPAGEDAPLAARAPVGRAEVTVLGSRELTGLRKGYRMLEMAGFWLPVTALALAAAGIAVAVGRRRAVTATALGTAVGATLLGFAVAVGRELTLAGLSPQVSRSAVGEVYDALTATLRTAAWLIVATGLAVALAARVRDRRLRRRAAASAAPPRAPVP